MNAALAVTIPKFHANEIIAVTVKNSNNTMRGSVIRQSKSKFEYFVKPLVGSDYSSEYRFRKLMTTPQHFALTLKQS